MDFNRQSGDARERQGEQHRGEHKGNDRHDPIGSSQRKIIETRSGAAALGGP